MDIGSRIRRTGNTAANGITDTVDEGPMFLGQLYSSQRVGRLTTLRDGNDDITLTDDRIPVPELRSVLHFHRYPTESLYQLLADESCMPGSTASHDDDPFGFQHLSSVID